MSTIAVSNAVEDGHIGSWLNEAGETDALSVCKKDQEQWPCAEILRARSLPQGHISKKGFLGDKDVHSS